MCGWPGHGQPGSQQHRTLSARARRQGFEASSSEIQGGGGTVGELLCSLGPETQVDFKLDSL